MDRPENALMAPRWPPRPSGGHRHRASGALLLRRAGPEAAVLLDRAAQDRLRGQRHAVGALRPAAQVDVGTPGLAALDLDVVALEPDGRLRERVVGGVAQVDADGAPADAGTPVG